MSLYLQVFTGVSYEELRTVLTGHQKLVPLREDLADVVLQYARDLGQPFRNPDEVLALVSWLAYEGLHVAPLPLDLDRVPFPVTALTGFEVYSRAGAMLDVASVSLVRALGRSSRTFAGRVKWVEEGRSQDRTVRFSVMGLAEENHPLQETPAVLLETNIDDQTPEALGYVLERLMREGARDAWLTPIVMKKSRSAVLLGVLAPLERAERLAQVIFEETTTLGIRRRVVDTFMLDRRLDTVETPFGRLGVKVGFFRGQVRSVHPEFDDCVKAAEISRVPLRVVVESAVKAWRITHDEELGGRGEVGWD